VEFTGRGAFFFIGKRPASTTGPSVSIVTTGKSSYYLTVYKELILKATHELYNYPAQISKYNSQYLLRVTITSPQILLFLPNADSNYTLHTTHYTLHTNTSSFCINGRQWVSEKLRNI